MKIIKMSVDTFWKGEVRVQGQIEDETKVYQTRIFIKGSQIYDYSCSCAEGNSFRVPACMQKRFRRLARQQKAEHTAAGFDFAGDPDDDPGVHEPGSSADSGRGRAGTGLSASLFTDPARRSAFGGTDRTGKTVYCEKPAGICTGGSQRKTGGIRKRHGV